MARSRNIKPGLFKNEILGTQDPYLTILFTGLWCLADKDGKVEDRPLRIKAEIFPYREGLDINGYLTVLSRLGFIRRYVANDIAVIQVINFHKHQNPHHTEKPSQLPDFIEGSSLTVNSPLNNGYTPADSLLLIPDSLFTDSVDITSSSDDTSAEQSKPEYKIPYSTVFDLYDEICVSLPKPRIRDDERKKYIKRIWNMDKMHQDVEFFRWLFNKVESSNFLTGRNGKWVPVGFDWILKPANFKKIVEGNYDNR